MGLAAMLGRLALGPLARALPTMGETERAALEAGTVGFEGRLFAGRPDFDALLAIGSQAGGLSAEEQAFLDKEVRTLCAMLDDYAIDTARDLPAEVWQFLREKKFFGMIIPKEHGGLGFSNTAHAAVVTRLATINVAAAVTVMVPNSIGPAELLLHYGTDVQKRYYLPRLARGQDLPCFALTNPYAGSDAASIPDRGVLVEREFNGRRTRGFLVSFSKRYITLAPVATVVGLAFHAFDDSKPDGERDLGITCALVPVPYTGVDIGNRHYPMNSAFMNGPIRGKDVFIPVEWVIGGEAQIGKGWRMLMECLAAGRAISLPSLGSSLQQLSVYAGSGYARIREQFGLPIGKFHAVAAVLAQTAVELYATDAARRYTAAALDQGERPSVASAILKLHLTEAGRRAINQGMDVLGGKAIIAGPSNLLSNAYRNAPIAITVEGANILTRALIIFGQGAVRCHPYVQREMQAVQQRDAQALGRALLGHMGHVARNLLRSLLGVRVKGHPPPELLKEARLITQLSAKFALTSDLAMGLLGGQLKRMELLSQRLGDVLSHLYIASAALWRYQMDNDPGMLPFARAAVRVHLHQATETLREVYANLPLGIRRSLGWVMLRGLGFANIAHLAPLRDQQLLGLAESLRSDPRVMKRLTPDISTPKCGGLLDLQQALALADQLGPDEIAKVNRALRTAMIAAATPALAFAEAAKASAAPHIALAYLHAADKVIQVDDFASDRPARTNTERVNTVIAAVAAPGISVTTRRFEGGSSTALTGAGYLARNDG